MPELNLLLLILVCLAVFFMLIWLNSKIIFGFYAACEVETTRRHLSNNKWKYYVDDEFTKMIFWKIKLFCLNHFGEFYSKAICTCPICMSSLHSFWIWIPIYSLMPFTWTLIYTHAIYILALAGLNKLIVSWKGIEL